MSLASMKVSQLKEEAAKAGVTIKSTMKKADIVAAIEAVQADEAAVFVEAEVIDDGTSDDEQKGMTFQPICNVGTLSANFDALEAYVDGILDDYEGWKPSAEKKSDVEQCDEHKKQLNALANDLDSRRKSVKAKYLAPLNAFEARANGIRDKVKATSDRLNAVVNAAKNTERNAKQEALKQHYEEFAEFLAEVVPYEKLHDPKWLNKEPKLPKAKEELEAKVNAIAADWENLKSLELQFFNQAEAHFFSTLSLGDAVAYNSKLVDSRKKIESMKANMAAYGGQPAEPEPVEAPVTAPPAYASPVPVPEATPTYQPDYAPAPPPAPVVAPDDPPRPCVMVVDAATTEQMRAIGRFCGSLVPSVTGTFKLGTLDEVYAKEIERREAVNGRIR